MKRRYPGDSQYGRDRPAKMRKTAEPGELYSFAKSFRFVDNKPTPRVLETGLVVELEATLDEHCALEPLVVENDVMREGHEEQISTLREPPLTVGACTWNAQRFGMPKTEKQRRERDHVVDCLHWMFDANPWLDFVGVQEMSNVRALRARMDAAVTPINFQVLHEGPFLFSRKNNDSVGSMEWYPLLARADTRWKVENVYTHSYRSAGGNRIHICQKDVDARTDSAFLWEKGRVFRPVIVYHLRHADSGAELKIGIVHTTPKGKELHRPEDFQQILPVIEYMQSHPSEHWLLLGDFYLPPEAVVGEINDLAKPFVAKKEESLGFAPRELFDRRQPLKTDRLVRLLFDEDARLLGFIQSGKSATQRPSGYRSYVLSGLEYRAAWIALGRLASWLHEGGDESAAIECWAAADYPVSSLVDFMRLFQDEANTVGSMALVDEVALRTARPSEKGEEAPKPVPVQTPPVTKYDQTYPVLAFMRRVFLRASGNNFARASRLLASSMGDWNESEVRDLLNVYRSHFPLSDPLMWDAAQHWSKQQGAREASLEQWFARHLGMAERRIAEVAARADRNTPGDGDPYRAIRLGTPLAQARMAIDPDDRPEPSWYPMAEEDGLVGTGEINAGLDQLEGKASRRVLAERGKPRIGNKKARGDEDAGGLDPRHYPIEPAPDVRRFRQTFWISFERELAARGLEIVAPVSATNLKSIHSVRLGLHTSARLADFAVTHTGSWNVKAVGLMSPELSPGTGGLVAADSEGLWVLWSWLHLSDHAPTGFFVSTQKAEEERAAIILEGLGRALDQQLEANGKPPRRQRAYRALSRERMWRELVKLSHPCLEAQRAIAQSPGDASKRLLAIAWCVDPKDQDLAASFAEMSASDALFAWLEVLAPAVWETMTRTDLPYREQVVRLASDVVEALAARQGDVGGFVLKEAMAASFRVLEGVATALRKADPATVHVQLGEVFSQAAAQIGIGDVGTALGFAEWAVSWLPQPADFATDLPVVAAAAAEMAFLYRALGWLLAELDRQRRDDQQVDDEWIAEIYPDARVRRGPGRYKPQAWMRGDGPGPDDPPPPSDGPPPGGRRDELPRDRRPPPPNDPSSSSGGGRGAPPGDRGGGSPRDVPRSTMALPGIYDLEAFGSFGDDAPRHEAPWPMTRDLGLLVVELDEAWIPRLTSFAAGSVTRFAGATGKLRRRGDPMTLGWVRVTKQQSRSDCGLHALANASLLARVDGGMTPLEWQEVCRLLEAPDLSALTSELSATIVKSNGLHFDQLYAARDLHAPGTMVLPPFSEGSCVLQYNDGDIEDIIAKIESLAGSPGAFVLIGGSHDPPHWRAAIVHRYTESAKACWEIIVADSQLDELLSAAWAQQLSDWIDDPRQAHRDAIRTDGEGMLTPAEYGFRRDVRAEDIEDFDSDPTFAHMEEDDDEEKRNSDDEP